MLESRTEKGKAGESRFGGQERDVCRRQAELNIVDMLRLE